MASKTEQRRQDLREKLTDAAQIIITTQGAGAVKARELAKIADCSVGAIYNVFGDLNDLIMAVNGRTFRALGAHVSDALDGQSIPPQQQLIVMSHAYLDFAATHTLAWRALFDLQMSTDMKVPDWYLFELGQLFALIGAPLRELFPNWEASKIDLMTRALFSSVHGIVLLGLEKRISGVPMEQIKDMIAVVLANVTSSEKA